MTLQSIRDLASRLLLGTLLLCLASTAFGEPDDGEVPEKGIRYLKVANTLRKAKQFERAKDFLRSAMTEVKGDPYWEAVGYETWGMLYQDLGENLKAQQNYQQALERYEQLDMTLSVRTVKALIREVSGEEERFAGIEIGSKGVKASVVGIKYSESGDGTFSFKTYFDDSNNTNVIAGTEQALDETAQAVATFFRDSIQGRFGLEEDRIFVVISSGVKQELEKQGKLDELVRRIHATLDVPGVELDVLSDCDEGKLVTLGTIPPRYRYRSSTYDIGSGNTKGGYFDQDGAFQCSSFEFGSKTLADRISKYAEEREMTFREAALAVEKDVKREIKAEFARNPGLTNRKTVFLMGGAVWAMTSYMLPSKIEEPFPLMQTEDFARYRQTALDDYEALINPNLSGLPPETRASAEKTVGRVQGVFNERNIIAGAIILNAMAEEYDRTGGKKAFLFGRNGYIGWITGYVVRKIIFRFEEVGE